MNADKDSIRRILTQSIVALCNTGLCFDAELSVEGLLGITLDKKDVFLVNISEVVSTAVSTEISDTNQKGTGGTTQTAIHKGNKRKCIEDHEEEPRTAVKRESVPNRLPSNASSQPGPSHSQGARRTERYPSSDSDDVVIVKEEFDAYDDYSSQVPPTVQQYSDFLAAPQMTQHHRPEAGKHMNPSAMSVATNVSPDWMANLMTGFDHGTSSKSTGQSDNTYQVTLRHVRLVRRWLIEAKGEQREVEDIPVDELDSYLADMWANMKRQDGQEYGLGSLGQIKGRLDYYLKEKTGGAVRLHDAAFNTSNQVLAAKRLYLKNKAHDRMKASLGLNQEEENNLWEKGEFGTSTADSLLLTVYYFCSKNASQNSSQPWCFDDVRIRTDSSTGNQFVELKHATGEDCWIRSNGIEGRDPVACFKEYIKHRPANSCAPGSPFFLTPLTPHAIKDGVWYSDQPVSQVSLETWKLSTLAMVNEKK